MEIRLTSDGSHTLFSDKAGQTYHSAEGAVMESLHVYVSPAFACFRDKTRFNVLEIGFGTGLNAFLTMLEAEKTGQTVFYETIEPHPVPETIYTHLNYPEVLPSTRSDFPALHQSAPDKLTEYPHFHFIKRHIHVEEYTSETLFDTIYYDAFSPEAQPEMWTREAFVRMHNLLRPGGILLTYSAKGSVKQALREAGFDIKRLPGAGSKHHMLKAIKKIERSETT